ncbi:MAG: GvpL/GvpF family gas vesicle protein [bacterium]|nr:GvpL/GvpF family gas vesicle protein [bacterium]
MSLSSNINKDKTQSPIPSQEKVRGKYLYCLISAPTGVASHRTKGGETKEFEIKGIEGKTVYTIPEGRLSAVVSDSEIKEYLATRENIITHQKVLEEILKEYDLLPVSFGTVVASSEELKQKILKPKAKELQGLLQKIEGKIELSLKVLWLDMNSVFQEIAESSQTIQKLKKSKNLGYQNRILAGELVNKLLDEKREKEKEEILKPLKKIADDFKENKLLGDSMILNVAFLVKKTKEKEFDKKVNNVGGKFDGRIKFLYVGPMPPFNFVELHLGT